MGGVALRFFFYFLILCVQGIVLHNLRRRPEKIFIKTDLEQITEELDDDKAQVEPYEQNVNKSELEPFIPLMVAFNNLSYTISVSQKQKNGMKKKRLLKNISGYAKPGQSTALMGPTGAGKSTLMDVISFRKTQGKTSGVILVNGNQITKRNKSTFLALQCTKLYDLVHISAKMKRYLRRIRKHILRAY